MTGLAIARWRTRYLAEGPLPPTEEERRAWDEAPRRLAMPAAAETEAIVCLRRVRIAARIRPGDGTSRLSEVLGEALEAEIATALRNAPPDSTEVVVWQDRREALADMLHRACSGDLSRAWAWRQAGLLPASGEVDAPTARAAAVAALAEAPGLAWPVLARLVLAEPETGSLTMLLAALALSEWRALLGEVAPGAATADDGATVEPAPTMPRDPVVRALLDHAVARPREAARARAALAALLARALARGAAPDPAHRRAAAAALAARIGPAPLRPPPAAPESGPDASPSPPEAPPATAAPPRDRAEAPDAPPAPALPPRDDAPLPTAWGGLLFLLPLLPPAGLLDALEDRPRALPAALHALGLALGTPPEDPALRAFCGGTLPEAPAAPPPETLVADTLAALEALLRDRLGPAADPNGAWLPGLCRRDALLSIEPGWIEAEFPLASADATLRRGAIDLDPGHLPWLGCVVRFRYA